MKRLFVLATATFFSVVSMAGEGKKYTVNVKKSNINWTGEKVTGQHTGTLKLKGGTVQFSDSKPVSAELEIDMNTIECTDLDGEYGAKLVGHLESPDFFSVEKYPLAKFSATQFKSIKADKQGAPNYKVTGTLTIKGISNEISFDAYINESGEALISNASVVFDRTKWDIKYSSGSFFENLGDKVIYDDIKMNFYLSAE